MNRQKLLTISIFFCVCCAVPAFSVIAGTTFMGRLYKIAMFSSILFLFKDFYINKANVKWEWSYFILMVIAFVGHSMIPLPEGAEPMMQSFQWVMIVLLLALCRVYELKSNVLFYAFVLLFVLECSIAVFEKISFTNVVDWARISDDFDKRLSDAYNSSYEFRATSLFRHPLNNANVVSLFMAFALCSNYIKPIIKYVLIVLGFLSLWAFNSRGVMLIWGIILIYRLFLYKKNSFQTIVSVMVLYFIIPWIISVVVNSGVLGRISEGLDDSSTEARFLSFGYFWLHEWNTTKILLGGDIIYMPGTELSLENGLLLNLGYWGWIIGSLKSIFEIVISYYVLPDELDKRDKFIILLAAWGVAFTNNNSFDTLMLTQYILAAAAMRVVYNNHKNGRKKWYLIHPRTNIK